MELHKLGLITEVHLWDFTPHKEESKINLEWMQNKSKQHSFVKILKPPSQKWSSYYGYYTTNINKSDVVIKADDDIVYVNISEFRCFVKFVDESVDTLLVSANVVNNGVIAHLQQKLGSIPLSVENFEYPRKGAYGSLWESSKKALKLHQYFVSHKSDFYREEVIQFRERLSINFIGFTGINAKKINHYIKMCKCSDEYAITVFANIHFHATEVVYMRLVVSHANFQKQFKIDPSIDLKILKLYL